MTVIFLYLLNYRYNNQAVHDCTSTYSLVETGTAISVGFILLISFPTSISSFGNWHMPITLTEINVG